MNRKWWVRGLIADLVIVVLVLANLLVAQGTWRAKDVTITVDLILYILAFVAFLLAAFSVATPRISWRDVGFALLVLSLII